MGMGRRYCLGAFNAGGLSRSTCTRQRAEQIASMIRHEQMDLMALQEVLDADALLPVIAALGTQWEFSWLQARPKRGMRDVDHDPNGEGYAFLWNKTRLRRIDTVLLDGKSTEFEPQLYERYRVDKGQMELIRDPAYGRFTPQGLGGGNFELRLLVDHIRYNGLDKDKDRFFWPMRQNEFEVLTRNLLPRIEDTLYGNQMPSYTIVMGDYNMNLNRFWSKKPILEEPPNGFILGDKVIVTVQDQPTTLKKPKAGSQERTVGYLHGFDHFSYNKNRLSACNPSVRRCDIMGDGFYSTYYGDFDRYRVEISDHIPVAMELQF